MQSQRKNKRWFRITPKGMRKLGEAMIDFSKLALLAAFITTPMDSITWVSSLVALFVSIIIGIGGLYSISKADEAEDAQEFKVSSKHRKYHIEIPKGNLDIQIKD